MIYRIYSAHLNLAKMTFATIGDRRAYDKVVDLDLLRSDDDAMRYWAYRIVGLYPVDEAIAHLADGLRDPSEVVRIGVIISLGEQEGKKSQAGKLLLGRFRELLDAIALDKRDADLNNEATTICESLIELFWKDIAPPGGGDGRNGFGAVTATTVEEFLRRGEDWFKWWQQSSYSAIEISNQAAPAWLCG